MHPSQYNRISADTFAKNIEATEEKYDKNIDTNIDWSPSCQKMENEWPKSFTTDMLNLTLKVL